MQDHKKLAKEQHALMLADRFYRRYHKTIKVRIYCTHCDNQKDVLAEEEVTYPDWTYICGDCKKEYFLYAYK